MIVKFLIRQNLVFIAIIAVLLVGASFVPAAAADVDPALCRALVQHTPDADVAYQPGVDVHGKAVAPADLPGSDSVALPQKFDIPITINLAKTLNLDTSRYPYNQLGTGTEAWVGTFSVEGNHVLFNGQPLSGAQQDNLAVLCMKASNAH